MTIDKTDNKIYESCTEQQVTAIILRDEKGRFIAGSRSTGGFDYHPENRANGSWDINDTPRKKIERMMKMDDIELFFVINGSEMSRFDKNIARAMIRGDWKTLKEMIDEVYGKPEQPIKQEVINSDEQEILKTLRQMAEEEIEKNEH